MKRATLRFALAVAVLAAGPAVAGQPAFARETQATPSPTPTVEVLDAGKAPLEQLRLSPPAGTSQRSAMTVTFVLERSGVSSGTINPPPTKATVVATLQGMTPDGNLQVGFSYPSFRVLRGGQASTSERRQIEKVYAALAGLSGQLTITPQGVLVDSALNVPPGLDPSVSSLVTQLGDQLRTLPVPLPEAPVGVGARWRATTALAVNGIEVNQVYEYTLKKHSGSRIELGVRGTQTAGRQTVQLPSVAPDAQLQVQSYKTTSRGSYTIDLTSLLPVANDVRSISNQTSRIQSGSNSGTLRQHLTVHLVLKPATG